MNLDYSFNYVLENERVLLRPLEMDDVDHLLPFSLHEPELWKYSLISGAGRDALTNYIQIAVENRLRQTEYPFIVYDKFQQAYAGSTRFYDIQPLYKTLQLGYTWYGKRFQGSGLNKHCKMLLLGFAFETLGAERLELRADNDNKRSIAAMTSIGCKVDGILRSNMPKPIEGRRDSIVLSILRNEWFENVKLGLEQKLIFTL